MHLLRQVFNTPQQEPKTYMKITKSDYDALPAGMKAAFKLIDGTEEYSNNEEDAGALKNALDSEKAAKVKAAKERDDLKAAQDAKTKEAVDAALAEARKSGDFAAIEADYKTKLAASEAARIAATEKGNLQLVDNAQGKIIGDLSKIFTTPKAMTPYLKSRLKTEVDEASGEVVTRVLDAEGKVTAASIEDLKKEILDDAEFKGSLAAGKGSGSGATGHEDGSGATSKQSGSFSDASPEDKIARLDAKAAAAE